MTYQCGDTVQFVLEKGQCAVQGIYPHHRVLLHNLIVVREVLRHKQVFVKFRRIERPRRLRSGLLFPDYF